MMIDGEGSCFGEGGWNLLLKHRKDIANDYFM